MKEIKLTKGKFVIIDDDIFNYLNQKKWFYHEGYAIRHTPTHENIKRPWIYMHREVLLFHGIKVPEGMETDHINNNTLDNQYHNLRICTHAQNAINKSIQKSNTSGYAGVSWCRAANKWMANINYHNQRFYLGIFSNINDAINIRKEKAKELHGEFAYNERRT